MKVPFTNHEKFPVCIGSKWVQPGETREVDSDMLPQAADVPADVPADEPPADAPPADAPPADAPPADAPPADAPAPVVAPAKPKAKK